MRGDPGTPAEDVEDDDPDAVDPLRPGQALVTTRPDEVLFYGDLTATTGLDPRVVSIRNETLSAVFITGAVIVDDRTKDEAFAGGAAYFSIATELSDEPIPSYSESQVTVAFNQSLKQRFAMLIIRTTHPGFPELLVPLAGKLFVE